MKKQDWWLRAIQRFAARTGSNVESVLSVDVDSNFTLVIDQRGVVREYAYDGLNRCCQDTVDAGSGANARYLNAETVTCFDAAGNIRRVTEAGGIVAQFAFDDLDAE